MNILIQGGLIVDGSGNKPYYADIAIERDRISAIGKFEAKDAAQVIDAAGLVVTPGFIDGHTHSELGLLKNRQYPNGIYQGISTIVTGQCGLGFAPMKKELYDNSMKINAGIFSDNTQYLPDWSTFEEFLDHLDGCAVNVGANISHNAIRQMACGFDNIPLTGDRLSIAKAELEKALKAGATGLSVGLSYYPGGYSDTQELIELCRVVKEQDGLFCVHLRLADGRLPLGPVEEIAEVVRQTGVRLNMLHYRTGGEEDISHLFEPFADLEKNGADIHYEFYPYLAGAGLLLALVPGWVQEGSYDKIMERLTDRKIRKQLLEEMDIRRQYFFQEDQTARIIQTKDCYSPDLGKTIDEISKANGETFSETVIRLLIENDLEAGFSGVENVSESLKEKLYDDQYQLFLHEKYTIGSDTIPDNPRCHPRTFGTFPRLIKHMRERKVPVEFIIKKLTSYPAQIYHIPDRGRLEKGMKADICLMDYEHVSDNASFINGRKKPDGIVTLLVNGLVAMDQGTITGTLAGHSVKRR